MIPQSLHIKLFILAILFFQCTDTSVSGPNKEFQQTQLDLIVQGIHDGNYGETHSLIVYQNGEILKEVYLETFPEDSVHYLYSVTKSITSILVGIAIDKGFINGLDDKLLDFFPEYTDIQHLDNRKKSITLRDVLMMRTGFIWDEWTYPYGDSRNDTYNLFGSSDMIKHVLDLPMNADPGTRFTYNSGVTMLLSGIIENSSGLSTEAFAAKYLFEPLGIEEWHWGTGLNDDLTNTGWGLHLLPKDLLAIGKLFLTPSPTNQDVVSQQWLSVSTQNYGNRYGYQWWHYGPGETVSARGWGGQFIFINKEKNAVIVTTAGNFNNSNGPGQQLATQIMELL